MNTVTMSVRVPQEDADFIAGLSVPGATTPSDKLRALINDARVRYQGARGYQECLASAEQILTPTRQRVRELEHRHRVHSELLATVLDWLPAMLADMMTPTPADRGAQPGASTGGTHDEKAGLAHAERVVADRLFGLFESVLRMGVTPEVRGYDRRVVSSRLGPLLQIARVIDATQPPIGRPSLSAPSTPSAPSESAVTHPHDSQPQVKEA